VTSTVTTGGEVTTRLTVKAIEAAKAGDVLTDSSLGRGSGKLVLRVRARREWYFRHRLGGRSTLIKLGDFPRVGLPEARRRAEELGRLVREGIDPKIREREARGAAERDSRRGSLGQLLGAYVSALRGRGKVSARGVELLFNRGVVGPFPDLVARKAADIGPEDIQRILARLIKRGLRRDVNLLRACLRAAFSFGGQQDFDPATLARDGVVFNLLSNPVVLVPRKGEFDRARDRTLTDAELRDLWEALDGRAPPVRNAIRLAFVLGGQRMTQLLRAQWLDFDEAAGTLVLRDPKGRGPVRDHLLPVSEWAGEMIEELRAVHAGTGHIFEGSQGGVLRLNAVSGLVGELASGKGYQLRDLRRTAETRLARLRVDKETRAQLLSHGRASGVQARHYDRWTHIDEKREALALWEHHLRGVLAGHTEAAGKVVALRG
jgi:integrase